MTNKELLEKIAHLEAELAEVKEMAVAMEKKADGGLFKPEDRQAYWSISGSGKFYESRWENNPVSHNRYAIGNCFPTKQVAEDAVRVLKLIQQARESQDGFVPDWENFEQNKYVLYFDMGISIMYHVSRNITPILGYWENKSMCEKFIIENHDELIWFFMEYRR